MKQSSIILAVTSLAGWLALSSVAPAALAGRPQANRQAQTNARPRGSPFFRQLTIFNREGNILSMPGEPALYQLPMFSPDGTRLAVIKQDSLSRTQDLWIFDLTKNTNTKFTFEQNAVDSAPQWSADGKQIVFYSYRENFGGFYRKASDGTGTEEQLYKSDLGTTMALTDWSPNGRFLSFTEGSALYLMSADGQRKRVELLREEYNITGARFSPDGRFIAYRSDETDRVEIYVRPFDQSAGAWAGNEKVQLSDQGGLGMLGWRQDGKEAYYLASDGGVMAVSITTEPTFKAERPRLLFPAPSTIPHTGTPGGLAAISRDGQRFVFAVPTPPERPEITVPAEILAKYAGTYAGPGLTDVIVTADGNQLMIEPIAGKGKFLLYAASETSFYFKGAEPEIEFVMDGTGKVTHFMLYQGRGGQRAARKSP